MKRRLLKVVVFLLLGAIVNVAVALGFAQLSSEALTLERATVLALLSSDWRVDGTPLRYQAFSRESTGARIEGRPGNDPLKQMLVVISAGWPWQSFQASAQTDGNKWVYSYWRIWLVDTRAVGFGFPRQHEMPLIPLWPGFAINTLFYTAILWMMFVVPGVLRCKRRLARGLCPACAYPVGVSDVCTECGKALPKRAGTAS